MKIYIGTSFLNAVNKRKTMVTIILKAWERISEETIIHSFHKAGPLFPCGPENTI